MAEYMWQVYMLRSLKKKWYYTGSTNQLFARLSEHNSGKVTSTKAHTPLKLVFTKDFDKEREARDYERMIKDKRILKESLIENIEKNWEIV